MWIRKGTRPTLTPTTDAEGTVFGIGVPVHVVDGGDDASFPGEPTGLIVGLGSALPHRALTGQRFQGRVWLVSFDEPQHLRDGRGPFTQAEISEESLMAAPPIAVDDEADSVDISDSSASDQPS